MTMAEVKGGKINPNCLGSTLVSIQPDSATRRCFGATTTVCRREGCNNNPMGVTRNLGAYETSALAARDLANIVIGPIADCGMPDASKP